MMIAQVGGSVSINRRVLFGWPLAALLASLAPIGQESAERELIAEVECEAGLSPPLTLGMARVIVRPDAVAEATTPGGVRVFVVEAGTLAVGATVQPAISANELATTVAPMDRNDEIFLTAGTAASFVSRRVASVRNPGDRPAVALDVAVFHQEPRTLLRAFTTKTGVSFQLLAGASAAHGPQGSLRVTLERLRIAAGSELPSDLREGLMLAYVDAGALSLRCLAGDVFSGRAAAAAPYSTPGALQPVLAGEQRDLTAGSTLFVPMDGRVEAINKHERAAAVLMLALREVA